MMIGKIRLLSLAASMFAAGLILTPTPTEAARFSNVVTVCEPYQPLGHQRCTRYHYSSTGTLLFTTVYYIDENGVWYRI